MACSSNPSDGKRSSALVERGGGAISLQLTLPGGQSIDTIRYVVSNGTPADTFVGSYTYPTSAVSPSFVISDIPPGTGYALSLTCASQDGSVICTGSNPAPSSEASSGFDIAGQGVTDVNVVLNCTVSSDGGTP
jgi:hypothetical protein